MNCIILLLLLCSCGGFGCGNNGTFYADDGGRSGDSSLGNGNNIRRGGPGSDNGCGCGDNGVNAAGIDNGGSDQGISTVSGNPSHWQDYPGIPGRDNNCDN